MAAFEVSTEVSGWPDNHVDRADAEFTATALDGWHRAVCSVDRGVRARRTFHLFRKVPEYSGSFFDRDALVGDGADGGSDLRPAECCRPGQQQGGWIPAISLN